MKKKTLQPKLSLGKKTILKLSDESRKSVVGGGPTNNPSCYNSCFRTCPTDPNTTTTTTVQSNTCPTLVDCPTLIPEQC